MNALPIDEELPRIARELDAAGALVLVAAPGAGKTTRVPPALLDHGVLGAGQVVVLQPRRIAAQCAAARIAAERAFAVGREVGYQIRFENRTSRATVIRFATEGILLRQVEHDPGLAGVAAVVLDEFHERSLEADLLLALLREVKEAVRPDLKLLVMSATLDPAPIARYLRDCPVIAIEGRPHPVTVRYVPRPAREPLSDAVLRALTDSWRSATGHALVFLPGTFEIRRALATLEPFAAAAGAQLLPLHGRLSMAEQQRALAPAERRKIILATNVAETSLTIDGVDLVIDSGLLRLMRHDAGTGIDRLETERISKHAAEQRAGRAGRVRPGRVLRLWSEREHAALAEQESPEIRRVDLGATLLHLRAWGVADARTFAWFEAPPPAQLERARALLLMLGAQDQDGALTSLGRTLLELPVAPRLGCLLVRAAAGHAADDGALVAALIEERDILARRMMPGPRAARAPAASAESDVLLRRDLLREGSRELDPAAVRSVARLHRELLRATRTIAPDRAVAVAGDEVLLRALLHAYPDRLVRRRASDPARGVMVGGSGVVLSPDSAVRVPELFVAVDLEAGDSPQRRDPIVRIASGVQRAWLEQELPMHVHAVESVFFDAAQARVRRTITTCYRDLPLEAPRDQPVDRAAAGALLGEVVRERAAALLAADPEAHALVERVRLLHRVFPERGFPASDEPALGAWLAHACAHKLSVAELQRDLAGSLAAQLPRATLQAIATLAPETIAVPSGSKIRLRYEGDQPPVLAVRLQELFGLRDTPTIAHGRVRVLLHILGPNYRPVQVTQDLASFWRTTYAQVRKELRARYPKHAWPDDPLSAAPQRGARRRTP